MQDDRAKGGEREDEEEDAANGTHNTVLKVGYLSPSTEPHCVHAVMN
jgi:hypothetical protein